MQSVAGVQHLKLDAYLVLFKPVERWDERGESIIDVSVGKPTCFLH